MPAKPFLTQQSGGLVEQRGTQQSAGVANAGDVVSLGEDGRLDPSLMPPGIGAEVKVLPASEALASGDLINIWTDTGVAKARKADASVGGKEAHGFVLAGVLSGANATVYLDGTNTAMTGLTPGAMQFLSDVTPGKTVETAPTTANHLVQRIGPALGATEIRFRPEPAILLA